MDIIPPDEQPDKSQEYNYDRDDPARLARREIRKGSYPGDLRIRWQLPSKSSFRRIGVGQLEATKETEFPRSGLEKVLYMLKRTFIGEPIASYAIEHERLTKFKALALLSSIAISSVVFVTGAILFTLNVASASFLWTTIPISIAILVFLCVIYPSYRQIISTYPRGNGSFFVAKDNMGIIACMITAASLLLFYSLTVALSVAVAVQTLALLFVGITPYIIEIEIALLFLITLINLRGERRSSIMFALPTYLFVVNTLLLIIIGCIKIFFVQHHQISAQFASIESSSPLSLILIIKSLAIGSALLAGIGIIPDNVPSFKRPEVRNSTLSLALSLFFLGVLFIGISLLAVFYHSELKIGEPATITAQIARQIFTGPMFFLYPIFLIATLLILMSAANTSYFNFPRLASLLAQDNFLPHQFAFRSTRIVFSMGIIFLAVLAALLLILLESNTVRLINLYILCAFLSLTISQIGLLRHWWQLRIESKGWLRKLLVTCLGAIITAAVAFVIVFTNFFNGVWIVLVTLSFLVLIFNGIRQHYRRIEIERTSSIPIHPRDVLHRLIVPFTRLNEASIESMAYALSISPYVSAVYIASNKQDAQEMRNTWQQLLQDDTNIPSLIVIETPHRSFKRSLLSYVDGVRELNPEVTLTVILPTSIGVFRWESLFFNRKFLGLRAALLSRSGIIIGVMQHLIGNSGIQTSKPGHARNAPMHPKDVNHRILVPIAGLDVVAMQSLAYARSISEHVTAIHVGVEIHEVDEIRSAWEKYEKFLAPGEEIDFVVIESPYRSLDRPIIAFINTMYELHPDATLTVILPEFAVAHWWETLLHNQIALRLKTALRLYPGIVVTNVLYHLR